MIVASGATLLRQLVPSDQLLGVLTAYAYALNQAFVLPIVVGCLALVVSFFVSDFHTGFTVPIAYFVIDGLEYREG